MKLEQILKKKKNSTINVIRLQYKFDLQIEIPKCFPSEIIYKSHTIYIYLAKKSVSKCSSASNYN